MAEGFEQQQQFHVPQQSRRHKLRVLDQGCAGLFPLYDPSLLPVDLLTCAPHNNIIVKEEDENLMMGYAQQQQQHQHHHYLDPQSFIHINPSSNNHDDGTNNYFFTPHNPSVFDQLNQPSSSQGGLSLTLSSQNPASNHHRGYNLVTVASDGSCGGANANDVYRSSVPLGPFTGYASILKRSRFMKPAQELLEEFCDLGRGIYFEKINLVEASLMDSCSMEGFSKNDDSGNCGRKSRLLAMLEEVLRRYKQYYQQMQSVVSSFESVAGLGNAAPYANLAIKLMSKHFRCLKNAITDQLQVPNNGHGSSSRGNDEAVSEGGGYYGQRGVHNSGFGHEHPPVWRPQRGLPERAVNVLRSWLFEHFLHPYPTDTDKLMLAKQTGLSRNQVSNWFINARVRLWKPMVEEIHMLETRQSQPTTSQIEPNNNIHAAASSLQSGKNPSSTKRTRTEIPYMPSGNAEESMNMSYNNMPPHCSNNNVSLTLGLHQNNPFTMNGSEQQFGLGHDANRDRYLMNGFNGENRHFGGGDVTGGGHLLHDFVG